MAEIRGAAFAQAQTTYQHSVKNMHHITSLSDGEVAHAKQVFQTIDLNHSGSLDFLELKVALARTS